MSSRMLMEMRGAQPIDNLPALTAVIYTDGPAFNRLIARVAQVLSNAGLTCAGLIQHDEASQGRSRCDMVLENLETGARSCISEDRGAQARGCRLDSGELVTAVESVRQGLGSHIDALILSKFGKSEAEGSGFRPLIAQAMETGIPIIIGVPERNLGNWRTFAEDLARQLTADVLGNADDAALLAALGVTGGLFRAARAGPT